MNAHLNKRQRKLLRGVRRLFGRKWELVNGPWITMVPVITNDGIVYRRREQDPKMRVYFGDGPYDVVITYE